MKKDLSFIQKNITKSFGLKDVSKKHPKKKSKTLTLAQKLYIWETTKNHNCYMCKRWIYNLSDCEFDHVSRGKKQAMMHHRCNSIKASKTLRRIKKEVMIE